MTIGELLQHTHGEIDTLLQQVDDAAAAGKYRLARARFDKAALKLTACFAAEHAVVYPHLAFAAQLGGEIAAARREHAAITAAIDHLRLRAHAPTAWRAGVAELRRRVSDHAMSEQWMLFPVAALVFTAAELRGLADQFRAYEPVAASVAGPAITMITSIDAA